MTTPTMPTEPSAPPAQSEGSNLDPSQSIALTASDLELLGMPVGGAPDLESESSDDSFDFTQPTRPSDPVPTAAQPAEPAAQPAGITLTPEMFQLLLSGQASPQAAQAAAAQQQQFTQTAEQVSQTIPADFLEGADINDVLSDPAKFNEILRKAVSHGAVLAINQSVRAATAYTQIQQRQSSAMQQFFARNPELGQDQSKAQTAMAVIGALDRANPGVGFQNPEQLLTMAEQQLQNIGIIARPAPAAGVQPSAGGAPRAAGASPMAAEEHQLTTEDQMVLDMLKSKPSSIDNFREMNKMLKIGAK